jgi:hypothetical protein
MTVLMVTVKISKDKGVGKISEWKSVEKINGK